MWPAFWLLGQPSVTDRTRTNVEIDVVEHYGVMPNGIFSTLHLWHPDGKHPAKGDVFIAPGLTEGFHNYGVMVEEADITWYFDGIEISRQKTPEEAKVPLYLLVDLAMGGGWPIDKAVNPSYMYLDYVRAMTRPQRAAELIGGGGPLRRTAGLNGPERSQSTGSPRQLKARHDGSRARTMWRPGNAADRWPP